VEGYFERVVPGDLVAGDAALQTGECPGVGFLQCAGDTDEKSGCAGDSCDTVEKGSYKPSDNQRVVLAPVLLAIGFAFHFQDDNLQSRNSCLEVATFPPPDLPKGWQFLTRTAAPPRAPSSVS